MGSLKIKTQIRKSLVKYTKPQLKNYIIDLLLKKNKEEFVIGNECLLCGEVYDLNKHHLKPKVLGGSNDKSNLITLCYYCHWYLHNNPKFKIYHSKLVRFGMEKAKQKGKNIGRPKGSRDVSIRSKKGYYKNYDFIVENLKKNKENNV